MPDLDLIKQAEQGSGTSAHDLPRAAPAVPAADKRAYRNNVNPAALPSAGVLWFRRLCDVEAEVEDWGAVRDSAAGNEVHASGGDDRGSLEADAAGGFGDRAAIDQRDSPAHRFR